jgi:Family of unknown function (DUF6130)
MMNVISMSIRAGTARRRRWRLAAGAAGVALVAALAGCSSGGSGGQPSTPASTAMANRPSSPAKLTIEAPRNGQAVRAGGTIELRLGLRNARIVSVTSTNIHPDQGHVHVSLDGRLISMNYQLSQALPKLTPGTHVLQVEFVASDHLPFDPRVITQAAFEVRP